MDASLSLSLFGPARLTLGGRLVRLHSAKTLALLAFLAVETERPHSRAKLAGLLWGASPEHAARQSLRQALYSLKTVADGRLDPCLATDHEIVRFVPGAALEVDVHRLLAGDARVEAREFLEGIAVDGSCEAFHDWLAATRERFHALSVHLARQGILDPDDAEPLIRAARAAERVYAFGNALELYERALGILSSARPALEQRYAEVLLLKEACLERLGRRAEQAATIREAIAVVEPLRDRARLAAVLLRQAEACAYLGDYPHALAAGKRSLEIYRALSDRPGEAEALRELGFVHWRKRDYASALECARRALELHRSLGDIAGEASALHNLAEIYRGLGSPKQALEWYGQALRLHWSARNHEGEILTLFGMANALQQAGNHRDSRRKYEEALSHSERYGERTMQSRALHALALQRVAENDLEAGLHLMRRALELDRAIGYAHALGHDLLDIARMHSMRAERAQSRAALQEAAVWFRYTDDTEGLTTARAQLSRLEAGESLLLPHRGEWVKSHLPLGEGKVYCEFESPLAGKVAA